MDIDRNSSTTSSYEEISDFIDDGSSSTGPIETSIQNQGALLNYVVDRVKKHKDKIKKLENEKKPEKEYFKLAKLNFKISNIIFLILPILQLFITVWALQHFNIIENGFLSGLKILLGLIGVGTIVQLVYIPIKLMKINERLDDLEEYMFRK